MFRSLKKRNLTYNYIIISGTQTSVEFCGGTHLRRAGHMEHMVISSEEAIAKGIRRIVALTGPEARKALAKERLLLKALEEVKVKVGSADMGMKEKVRLITELNEDISAAVISYHKKDEMRGSLKTIKKKIDDEDRAKKAAVMGDVVEAAKAILTANPGLPYLVCELEAYASNKAIDGALKQVKLLAPETPTIFFSGDEDTGKILCMSYSSKAAISSGLKANDWCGSVQKLINGKGGGKPDNAQASGTNVSALSSAMETAHKFAMEKLGVAKTTVAVPASSGDAKPNPAAKSSGAAKSGAAVGGGSSAVSAPSGSAGSLLVQVAAKYAGQTVAAQSGDSFTFKELYQRNTFTYKLKFSFVSLGGRGEI